MAAEAASLIKIQSRRMYRCQSTMLIWPFTATQRRACLHSSIAREPEGHRQIGRFCTTVLYDVAAPKIVSATPIAAALIHLAQRVQ